MMAANFHWTEKQIKTEFTELFLIRMGRVGSMKEGVDKSKAQRRKMEAEARKGRAHAGR